MAYAFVMDVPAPIEFYDALHAEIGRRSAGGVDGLLLHLGRETPGGFQIIEVWESRELCERNTVEIVNPAMAELAGAQPPPMDPSMVEFEPRGLVVPAAHVAV